MRAYEESFPPYNGPPLSKRQQEDLRRRQQRIKSGSYPPEDADAILAVSNTDSNPPRNRISHFVMNLPDTAIEFLDAFRGVLSQAKVGRELIGVYQTMPMIHCHCFTRFLDPVQAEADIREVSLGGDWISMAILILVYFQRVKVALGSAVDEDVSLHLVRSVAPNKDMYCISFRLPRQVAFE